MPIRGSLLPMLVQQASVAAYPSFPDPTLFMQKTPVGPLSRTARSDIFRLLQPYLFLDKEIKALETYLHLPEGTFEEKKLRLFVGLEKVLEMLERVSMPRLLVTLKHKKGDCHYYCHDIPEALYEYRQAVRGECNRAEIYSEGRGTVPGAGGTV
jgi:hypothetical protein